MRLNTSKSTLKMTDENIALEKNFQPRVKDPVHYTPIFLTPEMQEEVHKKNESLIEEMSINSKLMNKGNGDDNS